MTRQHVLLFPGQAAAFEAAYRRLGLTEREAFEAALRLVREDDVAGPRKPIRPYGGGRLDELASLAEGQAKSQIGMVAIERWLASINDD